MEMEILDMVILILMYSSKAQLITKSPSPILVSHVKPLCSITCDIVFQLLYREVLLSHILHTVQSEELIPVNKVTSISNY